jgi:TIR domain-containing protein
MSGQIFISYRREESLWSARSLNDLLSANFGPNQIFMDIDAIALGEDFVKAIERTVAKCDVLIAVIGNNWLTSKDELGGRRLDNPEDFVRMEIGIALRRGIPVIPVLVDGAAMPKSTDLPRDLQAIVRRQAVEHNHFTRDAELIISAINHAFGKTAAEDAAGKTTTAKKPATVPPSPEVATEEKKRSEAEQRQREEKERLEAEQREKDRLEAERLEKDRLEAERLEKERLEAEQKKEEQERPEQKAHSTPRVEGAIDVFITFKNLDEKGAPTRDSEIATNVYQFLTAKGLMVFFSAVTLEDLGTSAYKRAIDKALDSATVLVAIGTSRSHLDSQWVSYEWDSFYNDILSGIKPNGSVFTYIEGMTIAELPRTLRQTQTFMHRVSPTKVRKVPQDSCQLPGRKGFSAIPELPKRDLV